MLRLLRIILIFVAFVAVFWIGAIMNTAEAEAPKRQVVMSSDVVNNPIKNYAFKQVDAIFGAEHWEYFNKIIMAESNWKPKAQNPKSSAYGLGQLLLSTEKSLGYERTDDPYKQVDMTIVYIQQRYGNPKKGWDFWSIHKWY